MFFFKMAASSHFGCPKITLYRISYHFRSIPQFLFMIFFTKWLPAAILDVRKSRSVAFLAKMAAGGHVGCPKITFDHISGHFRSNDRRCPIWMSEIHFRSHFWPFQIDTQLYFFWKFGHFIGHFRSIRNFNFFGNF